MEMEMEMGCYTVGGNCNESLSLLLPLPTKVEWIVVRTEGSLFPTVPIHFVFDRPKLCILATISYLEKIRTSRLEYEGRVLLDKCLLPPSTPRKALDR